MATVAERIDPTSPHYDAAFAELRAKAFGSFAAHQHDMKIDPTYRKVAQRVAAAEDRKIKKAMGI